MTELQEQNWWDRNWKWLVPVGGLASLALFAGFIAMIMCLVFGMMKSSDVYRESVAVAQAHRSVQAVIGTPLKEGLFVSGKINTRGSSGDADLAIPISGPDGKATIYVVAKKSAGQWTFSTLIVEVKDSGQRIDLLE
jgi:hypothetical protein